MSSVYENDYALNLKAEKSLEMVLERQWLHHSYRGHSKFRAVTIMRHSADDLESPQAIL